ncbi:MAG: hypothetical protein ACRDHW_17975 [Ktedonobacteraceae bacterium]
MTEQNEQPPLLLGDIQHACGIEEDMEFDVPFATFTWAYWQEAQVRTFLGFSRFQRAITDRKLQLAAFIALEMQQTVMDLQKEVCSWLESGVHEEDAPAFSARRSHEQE